MRELVNWRTYNGNRLHRVGFDELQLDTLQELFKETRVNKDGIDRDGFLASVRYNSVQVGSNASGITALSVYNYQPYSKGGLVYLEALAVDEEYRHRGIGSLALTNVINEARNLECCKVQLMSRKSAVEFYRAHGFSYEYSIDTKSPYVPMRLNLSRVDSPEETTLRSLVKPV